MCAPSGDHQKFFERRELVRAQHASFKWVSAEGAPRRKRRDRSRRDSPVCWYRPSSCRRAPASCVEFAVAGRGGSISPPFAEIHCACRPRSPW